MVGTPPGNRSLHLDRGVWTVPGLRDGCEALAIITSAGEYVGPIAVRPGVDRARLLAHLEILLDLIDPSRPTLTLLPRDDMGGTPMPVLHKPPTPEIGVGRFPDGVE